MKGETRVWLSYAEETKYPLGGVLPDFEPDAALCLRCVVLAEDVTQQVRKMIGS